MSGGPLWQTQGGQVAPERRWIAVGAAAVLLLAVLGALLLLSQGGEPRRTVASRAPGEEHPYAQHLRISDVQMAIAETFLGARVYYIDAMLHNDGERTVAGLRLEATFHDALGQVVQRDPLRALALIQRVDHVDALDMSVAPIGPGQVGQVRLTLDHISAEWNGAYPELRVVDVSLH